MKPRYKTGDQVSYGGKVFRIVRTVMERTGIEYDLGDKGTELRVAEKELVLVEKRGARDGQEVKGALPRDCHWG